MNKKNERMSRAKPSLHKMVKLNVGGDRYTTSIDTLTGENDRFFTKLFSQQWELKLD
jgi:hypothetical protein